MDNPSHWRTPSFFKMVKTTNQLSKLVYVLLRSLIQKKYLQFFLISPLIFFGSNGFSSTNLPSGKRYCNSSLLKMAHLWLISH